MHRYVCPVPQGPGNHNIVMADTNVKGRGSFVIGGQICDGTFSTGQATTTEGHMEASPTMHKVRPVITTSYAVKQG